MKFKVNDKVKIIGCGLLDPSQKWCHTCKLKCSRLNGINVFTVLAIDEISPLPLRDAYLVDVNGDTFSKVIHNLVLIQNARIKRMTST